MKLDLASDHWPQAYKQNKSKCFVWRNTKRKNQQSLQQRKRSVKLPIAHHRCCCRFFMLIYFSAGWKSRQVFCAFELIVALCSLSSSGDLVVGLIIKYVNGVVSENKWIERRLRRIETASVFALITLTERWTEGSLRIYKFNKLIISEIAWFSYHSFVLARSCVRR